MKIPLRSVFGYFVLGVGLKMILVVAAAYPIKWLWNGCVSGWLQLPEMGTGASFGILLLLVLLSTVIRGVKVSANVKS